jgi:hypothetical protein
MPNDYHNDFPRLDEAPVLRYVDQTVMIEKLAANSRLWIIRAFELQKRYDDVLHGSDFKSHTIEQVCEERDRLKKENARLKRQLAAMQPQPVQADAVTPEKKTRKPRRKK